MSSKGSQIINTKVLVKRTRMESMSKEKPQEAAHSIFTIGQLSNLVKSRDSNMKFFKNRISNIEQRSKKLEESKNRTKAST